MILHRVDDILIFKSKRTKQGMLIRDRGLFMSHISGNHKWKENGVVFPFCLKCGIKYIYSHLVYCPVSIKAYNRVLRPRHEFKVIKLTRHQDQEWNVEMCIKCGLIPEAEFQTFRVDKETKCAYITSKKYGVSNKRIPCSLTDEEWLIQDILT